jgi:hypothetical protein
MDLARPHGVVVDAAMFSGLPRELVGPAFARQSAYIKGIADLAPIDIWATSEVRIPLANRRPIGGQLRTENLGTVTVAELERRGHYVITPASLLLDRDSAVLRFDYEFAHRPGGPKARNMSLSGIAKPAYIRDNAGQTVELIFDLGAIAKSIRKENAKSTWDVILSLSYTTAIDD